MVDGGKRLLGGHRIRHYGLLASASCKANIARARQLMAALMAEVDPPAVHVTAAQANAVSRPTSGVHLYDCLHSRWKIRSML